MRKLIFGALVAILAFAMIGCPTDGGGDGGNVTPPTTYTVTFNTNGGSSVANQTIESGGKVTQPTAPTKAGYAFEGWYKETGLTTKWNFSTDTVTANTTLHAKWLQEFTVTFAPGDNYPGTAISPVIILEGNSFTTQGVTLPAPTWTGKNFDGWFPIAALDDSSIAAFIATDVVTSNMTLLAKWDGDFDVTKVTISFLWGTYNGGEPAPANVEIVKGFSLRTEISEFPTAPTWFGWRLTSWGISGGTGPTTPATLDTIFDDDTTLVAIWTAFPVISFNFVTDPPTFTDYTGGPLPTDGAIKVEAGTAIGTDDFPADLESTDEDHVFDAYYDDTGAKVTGETVFTGDTRTVIITAKFIVDTRIKITFTVDTSNGGTYAPIPQIKIEPGTSLGDDFPGPVEYTGSGKYVFDGWYAPNANDPADGDTTFDADTLLTAKFKEGVLVSFYSYYDADYDYEEDGDELWVASVVLETGSNFENADKTLPAGPDRSSEELVFSQWVLAAGTAVTVSTNFNSDTNVFGAWWDNDLTLDSTDDPDEVEKVYLENGSYVIYEFDVTDVNIAAIEGLALEYKASAATIGSKGLFRVRLMGPYIFEDFVTHVDTIGGNKVPYFGDFVLDKNGAYVAKFIPSGGANDYARDKNGPYINNTVGTNVGAGPAAWNSAFGKSDIEGNKWFSYTYTFNQNNFTNTTVANVNTAAHARVATNATNKIYFGIGLATGGELTDKDKNLTQVSPTGIVQLIKSVKLNIAEDPVGIAGAIPELPLPGGGTTTQVFASYIDPVAFSWRGDSATDHKDTSTTGPYPPQTGGTVTVDLEDVDLGSYDENTGEGYFMVNLGDYKTVSTAQGINGTAIDFSTATFGGIATKGPLTVTFDANQNGQRLILGLMPDNITQLLQATGTLKFTLDMDTPVATSFRYHLADPTAGGSWNATSGTGKNFGDPTLADLVAGENQEQHCTNTTHPSCGGESGNPDHVWALTWELDGDGAETTDPVMETNNTQTFTGNKSAATLGYFILQNRSISAANVKINSIKIEYTIQVTPVEPCSCNNDGSCDGLWMLDCDTSGGKVCGCTRAYSVLPNLDSINGIQASGGAKFGLLPDNGGLFVFGRDSDYATIDLQLFTEASESQPWRVVVDPAKYYRLTVTGKVVCAPTSWALQAQIAQGGSPYNVHAQTPVTGTEGEVVSFSVEVKTKTGAELQDPKTRIRLHDTGGTAGTYNPSFLVESIVLIELDEEDGDDVGEPLISFPPVDDDDE